MAIHGRNDQEEYFLLPMTSVSAIAAPFNFESFETRALIVSSHDGRDPSFTATI
jgi:hypothetical protein